MSIILKKNAFNFSVKNTNSKISKKEPVDLYCYETINVDDSHVSIVTNTSKENKTKSSKANSKTNSSKPKRKYTKKTNPVVNLEEDLYCYEELEFVSDFTTEEDITNSYIAQKGGWEEEEQFDFDSEIKNEFCGMPFDIIEESFRENCGDLCVVNQIDDISEEDITNSFYCQSGKEEYIFEAPISIEEIEEYVSKECDQFNITQHVFYEEKLKPDELSELLDMDMLDLGDYMFSEDDYLF